MKFKKIVILFNILLTLCFSGFSHARPFFPKKLEILQKAYPDVAFNAFYDFAHKDWKVDITFNDNRTCTLYWFNGKLLPLEEIPNQNKYWGIIYDYPKELIDPETLTSEQREIMKEQGKAENRKEGAGTSMFFFDELYKTSTRNQTEKQIIKTTFLKHPINIHKKIKEPLKKVEQRILKEAETDKEISSFLKEIKSTESYLWRIIRDTNRKSFHSLGIAIDILPKKLNGKHIYWSWTRDKKPDDWMLTPLKDRWMPPERVIKIFEEEGFIWGGKWSIWDNMHFEYHPELILYNFDE